MEFQFYWRDWWKIWPWLCYVPAEDDSPAIIAFGIGPLQFRKKSW